MSNKSKNRNTSRPPQPQPASAAIPARGASADIPLTEPSSDAGRPSTGGVGPVTAPIPAEQIMPPPHQARLARFFDPHRREFQFVVLLLGSLIGFGLSLLANKYQKHLDRPVVIPVFIQGQDRQGGQFALGVSRAMEYARRYRLDEVAGRRIEPWLLDENRPVDELKELISSVDPPVIVGPLQSTPALRLIPALGSHQNRGLGIPMILGIPTNKQVTTVSNDALLWRLSPTDDKQGEVVAKLYQTIAQRGRPAILVKDFSENEEYVKGLRDLVVEKVGRLPESDLPPPLPEYVIPTKGDTAAIQTLFEKSPPATIVYLGMTPGAIKLLRLAKNANVDATWIFTDSCITDPRSLLSVVADMPGNFFITFQAAPAAHSEGLQQYISYTKSTGGNVLFASAPAASFGDNCDEALAAPSYEMFGFDSYLSALLVLREARSADNGNVRKRMAKRKIEHPLLIGNRYEFDENGDSRDSNFYIYRMLKNCTRYVTIDELKEDQSRTNRSLSP